MPEGKTGCFTGGEDTSLHTHNTVTNTKGTRTHMMYRTARTAEDVAALGPTPPGSPVVQKEGAAVEDSSITTSAEPPAPEPGGHSAAADAEVVDVDQFSLDKPPEQAQLGVSLLSSPHEEMDESSYPRVHETMAVEQPAQEPSSSTGQEEARSDTDQPRQRRVGPLATAQRAVQFKDSGDAFGSLGLRKVKTENGGINCCLMYAYMVSSGQMRPNCQTQGYACTNPHPALRISLAYTAMPLQGCFLQSERPPTISARDPSDEFARRRDRRP